ncbi:hypothetical protein A4G26_05445 [Mycobacterium kansasii]|uniref:Uncharacterized protein n=1 Tax=Mycobacterium innocens TaxID=2341083 RepID=A0A498PUS2_9MYCO|nr:hypothetical protein A4G26_05445 [Mycobacterium kansasii]VBA35940.1 hypothetical protein LAUMK13_00947 [Mycobacterium innocens]
MKVRRIELLRAGWGAVLLTAPTVVLNRIHGVHVDRKAVVVTRVLGARHLVQALVSRHRATDAPSVTSPRVSHGIFAVTSRSAASAARSHATR